MLMRGLLVMFFSLLMVPVAVAEPIHRCVDSSGNLVLTDDPAKFPPGCKPLEQGPAGGGTFNVLTMPETDSGALGQAEEAAGRERAERSERQAQIAAWKEQARDLVSAYQAAETRRNQAFRRWSYSSRETVSLALEQMEQAREEKQALLRQIDQMFVPAQDRDEIRGMLDAIP